MIEIRNLEKEYILGNNCVKVINNINLTINDGEFVAIVGSSGSGKTSLLNLLGGLDKPSSGNIFVQNKDITKLKDREMSEYRRDLVGFIFQEFMLEGNKTVQENLMMPLIFSKVEKKERLNRVNEVLDKVGIKDKLMCKANELSGGQSQKVAIARALINEPKILLADEPTGNLDSKNGELIINLLKELNKNNNYTILLVTHNIEQASQAKRIVKIKDGEIL
ncbi:ABC transporter ATP-binding protein [Clostridioides difficile]|nr:ABC transporter ATP-binding protein [Clostridioides difficile]